MTTMPPKAALNKIREALNSHLLSWRRKYDLSPATAHQIFRLHLHQEEKKIAPKPAKAKPRGPIPVRPDVVRYVCSEDERMAQLMEGRARAAQDG